MRRHEVSEELEAAGVHDAAERSRVRRLVAHLEDGYHRGRQPPDEIEKKRQSRREGEDALAHFRARAKPRRGR